MRAVITGASSGIGYHFAKVLHKKGYDLTLIARREDRLKKLKEQFGGKTEIIVCDLSDKNQLLSSYDKMYSNDVEILINNAGFGLFGEFSESDMTREISMINTNITAVHILTKLFLKEFIKKNSGYILNVASIASFLPGPLLSTYYASKAYVRILSESIYGELKRRKSNVHISILCPGPVKTEFDAVANVKFSLKGTKPEYIAKYAVDKMLGGKLHILPTLTVKTAVFFSRYLPRKLLIGLTYNMQHRKLKQLK